MDACSRSGQAQPGAVETIRLDLADSRVFEPRTGMSCCSRCAATDFSAGQPPAGAVVERDLRVVAHRAVYTRGAGMRIHRAMPVAREANQAEIGGFGQRDGERGRRGDRRQQRDADLCGLHRQLVAGATGDDGEAVAGIDASGCHRADQLVERVVPAHVLAHQQQVCHRDPRSRLHGSRRWRHSTAAVRAGRRGRDAATLHRSRVSPARRAGVRNYRVDAGVAADPQPP